MIFVIDVILTTNSPGEVSAWVKPVVKKLNELNIEKRIYVFTPPCVFSSGKEGKVLTNLDGITASFNSRQYLKYILFNIKPEGFNPSSNGFVLFLGGDFMHAVFLGKRLNFPIYSYTERDYGFTGSVSRFYLSDNSIYDKLKREGVAPDKLKVVGNLMYDSVTPDLNKAETNKLLNKKDDEFLINLLPGSRPKEFNYVLPLFLNFIDQYNKYDQDIRFIISKAPFIDKKDIEVILNDPRINGEAKYHKAENIISINGIKIKVYEKHLQSIMRDSDFALTIPGTNNLELAILKTPMLVLLPLNKPELIPLPGLVGLIAEIPIIGKVLKNKIIPKKVSKRDYISLVNMIAEKEIVPELRGKLDSNLLVKNIQDIIEGNQLEKMKNSLEELKINKGASDLIIRDILKDLHV
jgi:lipid-A-disaccharide synthase